MNNEITAETWEAMLKGCIMDSIGIVVIGAEFEIRYKFGSEHVNFRYEKGSIFKNNVLGRLTHDWIYDIERTVACIVVTGLPQCKLSYDFMYLE